MLTATFVLVAALAIVLFGPSSNERIASGFQGFTPPDVPPRDFALKDQDGETVRLSALRGSPVALTFLYSTCEDTCPTTASVIRSALDQSGVGDDIPVLAVSVDPEGDTPLNAKRFLVERRLTGRMRFLLGTRAELRRVWKAYGIQPQGDAFDHSSRVLLIDAQGRQRVSFPFSDLTTDGLAHDLRLIAADARRSA